MMMMMFFLSLFLSLPLCHLPPPREPLVRAKLAAARSLPGPLAQAKLAERPRFGREVPRQPQRLRRGRGERRRCRSRRHTRRMSSGSSSSSSSSCCSRPRGERRAARQEVDGRCSDCPDVSGRGSRRGCGCGGRKRGATAGSGAAAAATADAAAAARETFVAADASQRRRRSQRYHCCCHLRRQEVERAQRKRTADRTGGAEVGERERERREGGGMRRGGVERRGGGGTRRGRNFLLLFFNLSPLAELERPREDQDIFGLDVAVDEALHFFLRRKRASERNARERKRDLEKKRD